MPPEDLQHAADAEPTDPLSDLFESSAPADDGGTSEPAEPADDRDPPPTTDVAPVGATAGSRLSTGIESLDRALGGGLPPGRILSYVAPPDTQSELLVKHLAAAHDCLYLSTLRPKWEVEEEVTDYVQKTGVDGHERSSVRIEQLRPDSWLEDAREHIMGVADGSIVVIDSVNELEALEKGRYVRFVDDVKRTLWDTGSVGLFYGIDEASTPALRAVTLRRADLIWQLRRSVQPGEVQHLLVVTKFRGGRSLTEPVKLELTDEVRIDTSRDIA